MTRRSVTIALLLLLVVASRVGAFNEPDGFRGVPWGATEEQMRSSVSIERACSDRPASQRWLGDRTCPAIFDLAGVTVSATYTFRAGRFVSVFLKFPSKNHERVAEIFSERYGEPTTRTTDSLAWIGTKAMVSLHRYRPSVPGEGFATLSTADEVKESARLRREQTKGAAKGL
jgi:hypothetical protein